MFTLSVPILFAFSYILFQITLKLYKTLVARLPSILKRYLDPTLNENFVTGYAYAQSMRHIFSLNSF